MFTNDCSINLTIGEPEKVLGNTARVAGQLVSSITMDTNCRNHRGAIFFEKQDGVYPQAVSEDGQNYVLLNVDGGNDFTTEYLGGGTTAFWRTNSVMSGNKTLTLYLKEDEQQTTGVYTYRAEARLTEN
ncbi:TPA: hypothetical protein ACXKGF_001304 [Escherichia coli]